VFANGGLAAVPEVVERIEDSSGRVLFERSKSPPLRIVSARAVSAMNDMMNAVVAGGTARAASLDYYPAAGKTGTSQEWRDAWFVGYTSYLVAGVWLGNDDGAPTKKVSGGNLPVEIWSRFMKAAHQGIPIAALPSGVWRNADAPAPEPAPPAPLAASDAVGAPLAIGRGGDAASAAPAAPAAPIRRALAPAASDAPVPPASIPNVGADAPSAPPPRDKNLLDKLFGAT